jgi:hypothetical protein
VRSQLQPASDPPCGASVRRLRPGSAVLFTKTGNRDRLGKRREIALDGIATAISDPAEPKQKRYCREPEAHPIPLHWDELLICLPRRL